MFGFWCSTKNRLCAIYPLRNFASADQPRIRFSILNKDNGEADFNGKQIQGSERHKAAVAGLPEDNRLTSAATTFFQTKACFFLKLLEEGNAKKKRDTSDAERISMSFQLCYNILMQNEYTTHIQIIIKHSTTLVKMELGARFTNQRDKFPVV
jgi:hypothetical protein